MIKGEEIGMREVGSGQVVGFGLIISAQWRSPWVSHGFHGLLYKSYKKWRDCPHRNTPTTAYG